LFENSLVKRGQILTRNLADLYAHQLEGAFVSQPIIMTNSKGGPLYALILASHNEKAKKIMNDISTKYTKRLATTRRSAKAMDTNQLGLGI
jgi:hypothetical protein